MFNNTPDKLERLVKESAQAYYTTGEQTITDETFDAVIDRLTQEKPDSDVLNNVGWGYEPDNEEKVEHKYGLVGSLDKVTEISKLKRFLVGNPEFVGSVNCLMAAKLDGLSAVIYYESGKVVDVVTRGNGKQGVSIKDKAGYILGMRLALPDTKFTGAVRGEILMTPKGFERYKELHPEAKNARNSAAGVINSKEIKEKDLGCLTFFVYTIMAQEFPYDLSQVLAPQSIVSHYNWLHKNFRFVVPSVTYTINFTASISKDEKTVLKAFEDFKQKIESEVVIDGLVISKETIYSGVLPKTETRKNNVQEFTYQQKAFKFQDEEKITRVKYIEWTMSKHQAYIPVVVFEPIQLEGTTVSRASGYNAKWIMETGIREGSLVSVRKAQKIIPQITKIIER